MKGRHRHTLLNKLRRGNRLLNLPFVPQVGFGHEGAVKAGAEVGVALGVLFAHVEEFCVYVSIRYSVVYYIGLWWWTVIKVLKGHETRTGMGMTWEDA